MIAQQQLINGSSQVSNISKRQIDRRKPNIGNLVNLTEQPHSNIANMG
jgi:hypothetical protein